MKVEGPKSNQGVSTSKKTKSGSSSGGADFSSMITDTAGEAEKTAAAHSISRVDGLFALQAAEDPTERAARNRMVSRAGDILSELDRIRMALLNGNVSVSHIENIIRLIGVNRERVEDPELIYVLDEIDLRAQVELAKLENAKQKALSQMGGHLA